MARQNTEHRDAMQDARARAGDEFDQDLERANHRGGEGSTADGAPGTSEGRGSSTVASSGAGTDQGEFPQHARKGQAQSPVEETPNQPEPRREGHHGGAHDS